MEYRQHTIQCPAVVIARTTPRALLFRDERFDHRPLVIGEVMSAHTAILAQADIFEIGSTEAQAHILANGCFEATRLARTLMYLVECAQSVVLWYGDDWHNLPLVEEATECLEHVKYQVLQPSCEVYLRFEKK